MRAAALALVLVGCGSSASDWTAKDTTATTNVVLTSKACEAHCLANESECTPEFAAACFDGIVCSAGSQLHRHGADSHVEPDAGCKP